MVCPSSNASTSLSVEDRFGRIVEQVGGGPDHQVTVGGQDADDEAAERWGTARARAPPRAVAHLHSRRLELAVHLVHEVGARGAGDGDGRHGEHECDQRGPQQQAGTERHGYCGARSV